MKTLLVLGLVVNFFGGCVDAYCAGQVYVRKSVKDIFAINAGRVTHDQTITYRSVDESIQLDDRSVLVRYYPLSIIRANDRLEAECKNELLFQVDGAAVSALYEANAFCYNEKDANTYSSGYFIIEVVFRDHPPMSFQLKVKALALSVCKGDILVYEAFFENEDYMPPMYSNIARYGMSFDSGLRVDIVKGNGFFWDSKGSILYTPKSRDMLFKMEIR